jgi:hypothetical protein
LIRPSVRSQPGGPAVDRDRVAFLLILAFAASLRLFHLTAPFTDLHAWRQLDTVAMARNFYEGSFWPFDPEVNWGGPNGYSKRSVHSFRR